MLLAQAAARPRQETLAMRIAQVRKVEGEGGSRALRKGSQAGRVGRGEMFHLKEIGAEVAISRVIRGKMASPET